MRFLTESALSFVWKGPVCPGKAHKGVSAAANLSSHSWPYNVPPVLQSLLLCSSHWLPQPRARPAHQQGAGALGRGWVRSSLIQGSAAEQILPGRDAALLRSPSLGKSALRRQPRSLMLAQNPQMFRTDLSFQEIFLKSVSWYCRKKTVKEEVLNWCPSKILPSVQNTGLFSVI